LSSVDRRCLNEFSVTRCWSRGGAGPASGQVVAAGHVAAPSVPAIAALDRAAVDLAVLDGAAVGSSPDRVEGAAGL